MALGKLLADRPRHDRGRIRRAEARVRYRQGSDPRAHREDRRRGRERAWRSNSSATARRRYRSTSGWPSRTWPSRPAPTPASSPPTRSPPRISTAAPSGPGARSDRTATREVAARVRIDLAGLVPLIALPHSPGNVVPVGGRGRPQDRPGLHRQLCQRNDDRPPASRRSPSGAQRPPRLPRDHRSRLAEDLPTGARGGSDRRIRRGGLHGDDADLRRLPRRSQRR